MSMISTELKFGSVKHQAICQSLRLRLRASEKAHSQQIDKWKKADEQFVGYIPETEDDALRKSRRDNSGIPEYTTIQLPYTYAAIMAAHSYWCTTFLSRNPVFQFEGLHGEGENQVNALEALHNYQRDRGRMLANLFVWFQDVAKYGEAWISPYWRVDRQRTSEIAEEVVTYLGIDTGQTRRVKVTKEIIGYQGNVLYNISPMKVFTDPRFTRNRFQEGEYVAIETDLSTNQIIKGKALGQYINTDQIRTKNEIYSDMSAETSTTNDVPGYDKPDLTSFSSNTDKNASDVIRCYEFYIELSPNAWGLGSGDFPEKWVFTVTKDFRTIIEARPLGCYHNKFPLAQIAIEAEGYTMFTRGLVEIFSPIQTTIDWLVNTHFFNVRQVLNNQWLFDPSRVETRDFENRKPGKALRLKPAAYGTDVRTVLMQFPVSDVTRTHMNDIGFMYEMGERLGVNDKVMGMTFPSSRKSATEERGEQTFSVSRLKTMAEYFSATGFSDMTDMLLSNSQQYYTGEQKYRLVGDAAMFAGEQFINVTPELIAGRYGIVPVDGTLPVDRYAQINMWREIITQMAQVPAVFMQYDLGKIFSYMAQLGGIKNLNSFKIQMMPDEVMAAQAQAGNAVPMQAAGGNNNPTQLMDLGAAG